MRHVLSPAGVTACSLQLSADSDFLFYTLNNFFRVFVFVFQFWCEDRHSENEIRMDLNKEMMRNEREKMNDFFVQALYFVKKN